MSARSSEAAQPSSAKVPPFSAEKLPFSSEKVLDALRQAQDDVERRGAAELQKAAVSQQATRRELEESRARNAELQRELDKATTQKNYVSDAFEASRKDQSHQCHYQYHKAALGS